MTPLLLQVWSLNLQLNYVTGVCPNFNQVNYPLSVLYVTQRSLSLRHLVNRGGISSALLRCHFCFPISHAPFADLSAAAVTSHIDIYEARVLKLLTA